MWDKLKKRIEGSFKAAGAWLGAVVSGKGFEEAGRRASSAYKSVAGNWLQRTTAQFKNPARGARNALKNTVQRVGDSLEKERRQRADRKEMIASETAEAKADQKALQEKQANRRVDRAEEKSAMYAKYGNKDQQKRNEARKNAPVEKQAKGKHSAKVLKEAQKPQSKTKKI
jgi:hypothetical protein